MCIIKASERVKPSPLCKNSRGIYHTIKEQRVAQILTQGHTEKQPDMQRESKDISP